MSNLRSELQQLASQFVNSVLAAMRGASLADLAGQSVGAAGAVRLGRPGRKPKANGAAAVAAPAPAAAIRPAGRRKRATPEEVQRQKDMALAAAKALKGGFSKGDVMKKSGSKADLGRALALLCLDGKLIKKGDRRNTRYWVR